MNIHQFARTNNLIVSEDDCGGHVIPGLRGHIYEYEQGRLGLMVINESDRSRPGFWKVVRNVCEKAGMSTIQIGDDEGCYAFDPENKAMAEVAIWVVRVRKNVGLFSSGSGLGGADTNNQTI